MSRRDEARLQRADPAFDALIQSCDYISLPLLCKECKVNAGYSPTVAHMRRLLTDANNGASPHIACKSTAFLVFSRLQL